MTAFGLELRRDRALAIWLAVVVFAYGGIMAAMYPIFLHNQQLIQDYMKIMPQEFLAAFGMTGSLADPGVFFTTYIASWLWPIVAGVAGIIIATRVPADLDRGFLDLPLSTRISRVRYLGASIAGQVVVMAVVSLAIVAGLLVVGTLVGDGFDAGRFLLAGVVAFAFGCAVAAVTSVLAVVTLSRGVAGGIVAGALIGMYLLTVLSQVDADYASLATFSAYHYFQATPIIDDGVMPWGDLALFAAVAAAGWIGALVTFRRRDLTA